MRSDPYLKRYFNLYNRRYHASSLPSNTIVRWRTPQDVGEEKREKKYLAWASPAMKVEGKRLPPEIVVAPELKKRKMWSVILFTLHHEMVHVKLKNRDSHGPAFSREMLRLAKLGAFDKQTPRGRYLW